MPKLGVSITMAVAVVVAGCTVGGSVGEDSKHRTVACVDTRDGDRFSFQGSAVRNIRVPLDGDVCFDVVDARGRQRHLCKRHEAFLRCAPI